MQLRNKLAQLFIVGFEGTEWSTQSALHKFIQQFGLGGVILFDYNMTTKNHDKNIISPEQVRALNHEIQRANPNDLPLYIAIDYEGGSVNRLKSEKGFPLTIAADMFAELSNQEAELWARQMAGTLKDLGFNLNFAPVVDVNVNIDNPILGKLGRCFSANPKEVIRCAKIVAEALLKHKIQCSYKHFPGHGSSRADSHLGFVDVTDTWQSLELEPYKELLQHQNLWGMVMTAHVINRVLDPSGVPATLSKPILTGLLRNHLKFDGIIISDDLQMKAISDAYGLEEALVMSLNAGADMFIIGNQLSDSPQDIFECILALERQVNLGNISMMRVDEACNRVLQSKQNLLY
jgi:beta-N-acetylhexosaminidase